MEIRFRADGSQLFDVINIRAADVGVENTV